MIPLPDVLIASHQQAVNAILDRLDRPGTDPALRAVVAAVLVVHVADPPLSTSPDPDCLDCAGTGTAQPGDEPEHCHCRCPWCIGCGEPLCAGPCPTVTAIAVALGLITPSSDPAKEEDRA